MLKNIKRLLMGVILGVVIAPALPFISSEAQAHGERAQEPFLRMRTIQWYDVAWSTDELAINETFVLSGMFRISPRWSWPQSTAKPDLGFLNVSSPGPVFVRKGSFVNGNNMAMSTNFILGRDYEFEVHMKARYPGRWHIHSMLNIKNAGPIVGPGQYVTVTGDHADFVNEITTLTGETVDMNTYATKQSVIIHLIWGVIAVIWLGYWLVKPLFFSRYAMVAAGRGDELISSTDKIFSVVMLLVALGGTYYGYVWAEAKYPITLPLQSANVSIDALPETGQYVKTKLEYASYRVPGRAMQMKIAVTNSTESPVVLGEFATATVRFINPEVGLQDEASKGYPDYLMADSGLTLEDNTPILPGETRTINLVAQDAAFETERLSSLIYDPDSRFGGLFFFYGADGTRHLADVGGVLVPKFL